MGGFASGMPPKGLDSIPKAGTRTGPDHLQAKWNDHLRGGAGPVFKLPRRCVGLRPRVLPRMATL